MRKTSERVHTSPIIPLAVQIKVICLSNINHIRDYNTLYINQLSCDVARATFFVSKHLILIDLKYKHFDIICLHTSGVGHRMNSTMMTNAAVNSVSMNSVSMNSVAMNSADRCGMNSADRCGMNSVDRHWMKSIDRHWMNSVDGRTDPP